MNKIYQKANDSLTLWTLNKLNSYGFEKGKFEYQLDSLFCINTLNNRIVACLLERVIVKESDNDGLIYFCGEKINDQWYFFKGPSIVIPRSMIEGHPIHSPLSYQQLHQIALKEVYSGYLKSNGEINEDWFTSQFEGPGWGNFNNQAGSDFLIKGKRFKTKKEFFEFMHLMVVKANWNSVNKDSIKQLPPKNNLP
ncbi:MAG: hypothetical protein H0U95_02520 [Bacteroidetes bacterium]|nr:hypothetical protein [Bacteroidota bacterium]